MNKESITTSAQRVKDAGFWCDEADDDAARLFAISNTTWDSEVEITLVLKELGLAIALLALGAPRTRFKVRADDVLKKYGDTLINTLEQAMSLSLGVVVKLTRLRNCFAVDNRNSSRIQEYSYWTAQKQNSTSPPYIALCEAAAILSTGQPLHIRLLHAGKHTLYGCSSILPTDKTYARLVSVLDGLLNDG